MGQERCECRRWRNRHCRQQKQTASKGHRKLFSVCQKKLRSQNGMTLTELLAAIVILGMIGTVLGGGVMMVKNVYQRTQEQADAEQALSLTAQLMTDEFANALEVKNSAGTSATGELVTPLLRSGNSHLCCTSVRQTGLARALKNGMGIILTMMRIIRYPCWTRRRFQDDTIRHLTAIPIRRRQHALRFKIWRSTGKKIRWELPGKRW